MPAVSSNEDRERALRFLFDDLDNAVEHRAPAKDIGAAGLPLFGYLMQQQLVENRGEQHVAITLEGVVFIAWLNGRTPVFAEDLLDFIIHHMLAL